MEAAGCELQVLVFATRLNGDVSWAPFAGLMTVISDPVAGGVPDPGVDDATVIFSSTWSFVFRPQHFTWRTCAPGVAVTVALNDVGSMIALPLSIE